MSEAIESQGTVFSVLTTAPSTYTVVAELTDFNAFSGSASVIDVSHLGSTAKEKLAGLQDYGQFTGSFNHVPSNAGQTALETAKSTRAKTTFKLELNDALNNTYVFDGFVINKQFSAGVDSKVSGSFAIEVTGQPSVTADDPTP